ncbi:MAG: hypothetical protein KDD35_02095, partial [Bdellovibrionales bacterium]|nr:hypothetical protein [Bdellovibrionales bacterium]
ERVKKAGEGVSSSQLTSFYHRVIAKYFSLKWFESFYRDWLDHPMRQGAEFSTSHEAFSLFKDDLGQEFTEIFSQEKTIDELISNKKWDTLALYRAIHLSALRRVIMFDDVKKTKTTEDDKGRLEVILKDIEGKDPFQIFRYFGASEELHPRDVEKIYKEFARANHPDTFSSSGSKEIKVLVHKVYSIVSDAYDILTNQSKREKFVNSIRAKDAQNQMVSERLMEEGLVLLRRGQFKGALAKFEEAVEFFSSTMLDLYWCWASIKSLGDSKSDEELAGIFKRLDKIPVENRRSAHYLYVSGLLKKAQGDLKGALSQFERSLTIDSNFLDVRRDISILRQEMGGSGEGLTGELTAIVGRLFKKQGKK